MYDVKGAGKVSEIMSKAKSRGASIYLPTDFVTGDKIDENSRVGTADVASGIADDLMVITNY